MYTSGSHLPVHQGDSPWPRQPETGLTRGYVALAMLERQCHQAHFQEPRTKGWLFDTLVTPAMMYGAVVWAPGLTTATWTQLERPQIMMMSRMIRSKPSVPHEIIRAEFATPPMVVEALFQAVCFIHRVRDLSPDRLPRRAFEASRQLAESGERWSWYSQLTQWFEEHGLDIEHLPPFQYDPDSPYTRLSHSERNRVLRQDLWQLYTRSTWITPSRPLPPKMMYYRDQFLSLSEDGFIQRPRYMDTYMSHSARVAIGQIRVSSHQLEIEAGRAARVPRTERICRLCSEEIESEEHFICRCRAYEDIRHRHAALFQGRTSLHHLMESADQRGLGQFILEIHRHRESLLHTHTAERGGRQSLLTDFFQRSILPVPLARRGVTLQQAESIRAQRRPRAPGFQRQRLRHQEITAIRAHHQHYMEERITRIYLDPAAILRGLFTPLPPMATILHPPHFSTGWS